MSVKFTNNAVASLAAGVSTSSTTISVAPSTGALFPTLAAGDWFPVTVLDNTGIFEIMRCTARSGDTLTVTRAQEGTTAKAFNAGARIEHRMTSAAVEGIKSDAIAGASIGFTPVQQGGGANQAANKLYFGWDGVGLRYQVDGTDRGRVWDASNFNPGAYMPVGGGAFTGQIWTASINGVMAAGDGSASMEVRSGGGAGDGGMAMIGFHAQGYYAIKMGVRSDGYFGLGGWSRAAWSWYSATNGDMVAAGNVGAYSDPRLKDDVEVIGGALGIIERLRGVRFTWNDKTKLIGKPGERDIGVMADEVEAVLPEIVGRSIPDDENGGEQWRVVAYDKLVPVLIEAVKELAVEVRTMNRGL